MPDTYLAPSFRDAGYTGTTGTTPYKLASATQIDALQTAYTAPVPPSAQRVGSPTATVLSFNFDGTLNNGQYPVDLQRFAGRQLVGWDGIAVLNGAANDRSRRWRDGEWNAFRTAANDDVLQMRRAG